MKILVLCGDNLFSYILGSRLVARGGMSGLFVSRRITGSLSVVRKIYEKTSFNYFLYRVGVQLLSKIFASYSLSSVARDAGVAVSDVVAVGSGGAVISRDVDMCVAINFDTIIPEKTIAGVRLGVLNVHAGDLPLDRGISPVVWAFGRGDREIVVTYYLMNGGIDTGVVLEKVKVGVRDGWSLFRTYCEVLDFASRCLIEVVDKHSDGRFDKVSYSVSGEGGSYNSWPSSALDRVMAGSGRRYFMVRDFFYLARLLKSIRSDIYSRQVKEKS